jgi:hypothetical protein
MTADADKSQSNLHRKKSPQMQTNLARFRKITLAFIPGVAILISPGNAQQIPGPPENQLVLPSATFSLPIYWQGDSIHSKWEPHTAMLIPVKFKDCPRQFYMQFDLGSPYSLFYKNKLEAIQSKYPSAVSLYNGSSGKLLDFPFKAGKTTILAKEIVVKQFDSSAINWEDQKEIEIIGTIGTDLVDGKVLIIDYPKSKLTIAQNIPPALKPHLALSDFFYSGRSILLPAKVQGKQTILYFDTGSSMFELLTDKKTCESLARPGAAVLVSKVRSWDKLLTACSLASTESINIAGTRIPIHYATYMEGVSDSQIERMMKMGIGGMTGNKIFLEYKLVLDTKNKKFGVLR